MPEGKRAFEDFQTGEKRDFHTVTVSRDDIIDFASVWDPQPMHLDEAAGQVSMLGGLTGSGWHMACLMMRGLCDGFLVNSTSQGSPGVKEVNWQHPMRPGDTLTLSYEVMSTRASNGRPDIGIVLFHLSMTNQDGQVVMTMVSPIMFARREAAAS